MRFLYTYLNDTKCDWPYFRNQLHQEKYKFSVLPLLNLFLPKKLRIDNMYPAVPKFVSHNLDYNDIS
jgi:hypothetical protein